MKRVDMREFVKNIVWIAAAATLAGCSSGAGLLDGKSNVPVATNVQVGNNLALPPDLQLATPGQTTDAYQTNGYVAPVAQPVSTKPAKLKPTAAIASNDVYGSGAAAPTAGDVFDQNGISKINPDGSKKTPVQLSEELRAVLLAKKRQKNPSYGTIANIGAIFSDQ
jgi:hypothetical protein